MFGRCAPHSFAVAGIDLFLLGRRRETGERLEDEFLAPEEIPRYAAFRLEKRRNEWLGGRIGVKAAISLLAGENSGNWPEIIISATESGRPFQAGGRVEISLSHSRDMAVGLASFFPCGVDVQEIRPAVSRVRERFSTRAERDMLARSSASGALAPDARLSLLWAGKEALMKTFDLAPLLFFSEINLQRVESARDGGIIFEFSCGRAGELEPGVRLVFASLFADYAFACSLQGNRS